MPERHASRDPTPPRVALVTGGNRGIGLEVWAAALNVADSASARRLDAVDPGWVRSDMGGPSAPRSLEQGADTIVWCATLPDGGPSGGFYHDRKPIPW